MASRGLAAILLLSGALFLSNCESKAPAMKMHEVQGPAGLSLAIPEGYALETRAKQLRIYQPERERSRSPVDIKVSVADAPPSWPETRQKQLSGRDIRYVIAEEEGGSGGNLSRLKAWVASNGRFVLLESTVQPDSGGDAEFRAEWAILPTLRQSL